MEVNEGTIRTVSRKDIITLFGLGDLHTASAAFEEKRCNEAISYIAETPNSRWIGMGDLGECINIKDKRFDQKCVREPFRSNLHIYYQLEARELEKLLAPIADKCFGILVGNHEDKLRQNYGYDLTMELCDRFGWKNLSMEAGLWLNIQRQGGHNSVITIFATHGYGGGRTVGQAINKLMNTSADFEANIYMMGHDHKQGAANGEKMALSKKGGELGLKQVPQKFVLVPSFHKTYQVGMDNYGAKRLYKPSVLGIAEIQLRDKNDEWEIKTII